MEHSCGLLTGQNKPVPLKSIAVALSIRDFVAGVSATLNYENEEKVPLEAFFVFPVDEDSAVYSFEALVDGKKIVAEIQEKMKAHENYEDALTQGHQAYLLEEDDLSRDVFCCNVGNLQPGSKVAVTLRYVQELSLEADGALRYVLPAILNPRYQLSDKTSESSLQMKTPIVPLEDLPYTLSMVATITSQHGIERVQSNCTLSPAEYLGDDKTSAQVSLAEGHKFDRDVELLIYYSEVHKPSVAVEMGMPDMKPDSLMGAPSAMVSFYPDIPEVEASRTGGEFVFLVDRSGSMDSPLSNHDMSQQRIDAAKETLILLLKSLPVGCYFNIYGFGSSFETFFPESVKYTQETMEKAVGRVKLMSANLGGTEILEPLQNIYQAPPIPGHPLQLFVFTDGEVADTFSVINEVKCHSKKHRCFSFGIGEGASTSLIKSIARVSGGTSEFITGKDRMQSKALRTLKFALQPTVADISVSWDLPPGLSASILSPEQTVIFRGQRVINYAQLAGVMPPAEASGKVCLKYTLQGKHLEENVTFSLHPKADDNFTIHRLAAKTLIQTKDLGPYETSEGDKEEVLNISIHSGVLSSLTAFIAINKELNQPAQGPLVHREIPRPMLLRYSCAMVCDSSDDYEGCSKLMSAGPSCSSVSALDEGVVLQEKELSHGDFVQEGFRVVRKHKTMGCNPFGQNYDEMEKTDFSTNMDNLKNDHKAFGENEMVQLASLQKANGSWDLDEDLAKVLGTNLEDMQSAHPAKLVEASVWATVLAVLWLHTNAKDLKCEWELLERKAVAWIREHSGSAMPVLVETANGFLKSSVDLAVFTC